MRNLLLKNKNKLAVIGISVLTLITVVSVTVFLVYITEERIIENQEYEVTIAYYNMVDEVEEFVNENVSLLRGLSAYIQMTDNYDNDEIYNYLDYLIQGRLNSIRNISVLEDTTIQWVYPIEGNEDAIGVDLAKIESQAEDINTVKNDLIKVFVGPVDLVQGGTGFIVRIPLLKNNEYWGMISVVLRSEITFNFIREFSDLNKVDYLITHENNSNDIIYGNTNILEENPLKFKTDKSLGQWDVYSIPKGGWANNRLGKALAYLFGLTIGIILSIYVFRWSTHYSTTVQGKNILEEKFIRDRFTGIYTREYFNSRAKEEFSHALRNKLPLSMIYFDLDHFKEANDTHGHLVGDEVLIEIVELVDSLIRKEDVFARWGGDEFIILMPETELSSVKFISERIRREVENLELCKSLNVTISIGCSQWVHNEYLESWFSRTDQALYESKRTGKNKVTVSNPENENDLLLKIEWLDEWNCKNEIINKEHKNLLNRCNMIIESSLSRSATDSITKNIEYFFDELRNHFKDEVQILRKSNYSDLEDHIRKHEELLDKGYKVFDDAINNNIALNELFSFLINKVIKGHLVLEDREYFDQL